MTSTTPFFPALRARLAALGSRTAESLRQLDFLPLGERLRRLLPAHLLASEDEGPGSRDRIFSLRLTFECFIWQFLKPNTSCRDVARAVQALFQSQSWGEVAEGNSAYVQARQRLPEEHLRQALVATAKTANRRVVLRALFTDVPSRSRTVRPCSYPIPPAISWSTRKPRARKPGVAFP